MAEREKRLLITGFDPFGGETINPSWEAVQALPCRIGVFQVKKLQVPTVYGGAAKLVLEQAALETPDVILCVGQAAGRSAVTPEQIGINLRLARIPDNAGQQPKNEPVVPGGADGLFSTLPVQAMADAIQRVGLPGAVSYSAGTFVCNDLLYTLLAHYQGSQVRVGFIHVPLLPQQAAEGQFSMPLVDMARALEAAISVI